MKILRRLMLAGLLVIAAGGICSETIALVREGAATAALDSVSKLQAHLNTDSDRPIPERFTDPITAAKISETAKRYGKPTSSRSKVVFVQLLGSPCIVEVVSKRAKGTTVEHFRFHGDKCNHYTLGGSRY